MKINFKSQKLTSSYHDLEPSHIKSSVEMRNMEDRHFYVGCNWVSEENDLLKKYKSAGIKMESKMRSEG